MWQMVFVLIYSLSENLGTETGYSKRSLSFALYDISGKNRVIFCFAFLFNCNFSFCSSGVRCK
jgi:hypothetical protein